MFPYYPTPTTASTYADAQDNMQRTDSTKFHVRGGYSCIRNKLYFVFPQNTWTGSAYRGANVVSSTSNSKAVSHFKLHLTIFILQIRAFYGTNS